MDDKLQNLRTSNLPFQNVSVIPIVPIEADPTELAVLRSLMIASAARIDTEGHRETGVPNRDLESQARYTKQASRRDRETYMALQSGRARREY